MSEEAEGGGERTEAPTPKKIEQSREKGQIARSRELSQALVTIFGVVAIMFFGGQMLADLGDLMRYGLMVAGQRDAEPALVLGSALIKAMMAVGLMMLVPWLVSLIAPSLIGGLMLSGKGIVPDLTKLDPIKGFARLFSAQAAAELGKAIGKMLLIGGLVVAYIAFNLDRLIGLSHLPLAAALLQVGRMLTEVLLMGLVGLALVAAADVPFQLWNHTRQLKMSRDEIKREMFESEGRPEVKAKRRQRAFELSRGRMLEAVASADVVITNPTHFAVALRYDASRMAAPEVVAKGADEVAQAIRERAIEHAVIRVEAPPLARALFRTTEVGRAVPPELFTAVAQILAWAYRIKAGVTEAPPVPAVPDELGRPFQG
jgi:flagellar biosynthesis protein FlhB